MFSRIFWSATLELMLLATISESWRNHRLDLQSRSIIVFFWSCSDLSWLLYTADYCHTLSVGIWKKMLWRLGLSAGPFTTQWLHKTEFSLLREDSKALRSRFVKALHACWLPCRRHRRAADGWDRGEAVCKRYVVDSARFGIIRGWDGKASKPGAAVVARRRPR